MDSLKGTEHKQKLPGRTGKRKENRERMAKRPIIWEKKRWVCVAISGRKKKVGGGGPRQDAIRYKKRKKDGGSIGARAQCLKKKAKSTRGT